MKKLLLSTSAILGAFTLVVSSASAQTAQMMRDQKASMKASFGGTIAANLQGTNVTGDDQVFLSMPTWRNYISVQADGQASALNLTYGGYLRYRFKDNFGNANEAEVDKAYVYLGQKYFGRLTMGRDNTVVTNNRIYGAGYAVPGFSQDGDGYASGSAYYFNTLDLVQSDKALGINYMTPSVYGITLGYSFNPGRNNQSNAFNGADTLTSAVGELGTTHSGIIRYDGSFGPVTIGATFGGLVTSNRGGAQNRGTEDASTGVEAAGYTGGISLGYSDGKNIGMTLIGAYHDLKNDSSKAFEGYNGFEGLATGFQTWEVALGLSSPRIAGLSLGVVYANTNSYDETRDNAHIGWGVGYDWSENFQQTFGMDFGLANTAKEYEGEYSWTLANQVAF